MWPIGIALASLALAAWFQWSENRVPNKMTLSFFVAAIVCGLMANSGHIAINGTIGSCLAGAGVGFFIMFGYYLYQGLGAGCVKAQTAFGAWIGCAFPTALCTKIVVLSSAVSIVFTIVLIVLWGSQSTVAEHEEPVEFPAQISISLASVIGTIALVAWPM